MQVTVTGKKENKALGRAEITCAIAFENAMPSRKELREAICAATGAKPDLLVIVSSKGGFGTKSGVVLAHAYESKEGLAVEKKHLLVRDGLMEKPKAAAGGGAHSPGANQEAAAAKAAKK
jgi:ribosomal protein S24E